MERNGTNIFIMSIENGRHNPTFVIKNWWAALYHFKLEMQWNAGKPTIVHENNGDMHTIARHFSADMMEGCPPFHCICK